MTIASIETAIAMKCSFVTKTDIPKEIWILLQRTDPMPIYKIELLVCNHSYLILVPD